VDTTSDTIAIVELKAFTIAVLNTQRGPPPDGLVAFGREPCPPVGPAASAPRPLRATRAMLPRKGLANSDLFTVAFYRGL
jgi:hypothetical protein